MTESLSHSEVQPPSFEMNIPDVETSKLALDQLEKWLIENGNYDNYEILDMDYESCDPQSLNGQVAASVVFVQPSFGSSITFGDFDPETRVLMVNQQQGRWAEGTMAVPMGKIDSAKDLVNSTEAEDLTELSGEQQAMYLETVGSVSEQTIKHAALREGIEETVRTPSQMESILAGSFNDKTTGFTIHVVASNIIGTTENNSTPFLTQLPDTREHSKVELVSVQDLKMAEPISDGIKLALLISVRKIKQNNEKISEMQEKKPR